MMSFFFFFRWGVWFVWWQNGFTDHTVWRRNKAGFLLGRYQWSFTVLTVKKQITETKSRRLNARKKQKTSFSGLFPIVQERERDRQLRETLIGFSRCGICLIWISGFGIFCFKKQNGGEIRVYMKRRIFTQYQTRTQSRDSSNLISPSVPTNNSYFYDPDDLSLFLLFFT